MTEHPTCERTLPRGLRLDQIALAFDRVRDHRDWKAPIRATIRNADRTLVAAAIHWFTGTTAEFSTVTGSPDLLVVTAPGQRHGPSGDVNDLLRGFSRAASRESPFRGARRSPGSTEMRST